MVVKVGKRFYIGLAIVLTGLLSLLLTLEVLPSVVSVWPGVLIVLGLYLLYRGYQPERGEGAIFIGFFFLLSGIVLVLLNTVITWAELEQIWPLFIIVISCALFFYGRNKPRERRAMYTVPAAVVMAMGFIFLMFSLGIVTVSFKDFMKRWWPLVLVVFGFFVMLQPLLKKRST